MGALRLVLPVIMAVAAAPLVMDPASAAAPDNDTPAGAVALQPGDPVEQDTTEATTDDTDAALNANCGAPETGASVWYTYTPSANGAVLLDTSGTDYSSGLMVFDGTPTPNSLLTCGELEVGLPVTAGHTYYVMAFNDSGTSGGDLVLALRNVRAPRAHVSLSGHGVAFRGGAARIHGSYSCNHADGYAVLTAHILQRAGRLKIQAHTDLAVRCNGRRHHWSARLVSPVGTYVSGHAVGTAKLVVCGAVQCHQDKAKRALRLRWAPSPHGRQVAPPVTNLERPRPLLKLQRHWPTS